MGKVVNNMEGTIITEDQYLTELVDHQLNTEKDDFEEMDRNFKELEKYY